VKSGNPVGPRVYETEISAKPEQMLDWDAPLSAQPSKPHERLAPNIRDIIEQRAENYGVNSLIDVPDAYTGKDLYKTLRIPEVADEVFEALGGRQRPLNEREGILAMDYLNTIDLPVTRYLDQHSRHLGPANDPAAQRQIAAITENIERLRSLGDNLKASELDQTRARLQRGLDAPRTHNYVVRDDKFLEILRKLAIPGLVGGGGAITAYEPQR